MPLETAPDWWDFELELSPHLLDRMIDRDFSEAELRLMVEVADGLRPGSSLGRWIVETTHHGDVWEVVVEPDDSDRVIVVITAYKVTAW
jgi:Ser/Thr protein kinase RdoA (MazF antagonist)